MNHGMIDHWTISQSPERSRRGNHQSRLVSKVIDIIRQGERCLCLLPLSLFRVIRKPALKHFIIERLGLLYILVCLLSYLTFHFYNRLGLDWDVVWDVLNTRIDNALCIQ